jgi:hypothetical protein
MFVSSTRPNSLTPTQHKQQQRTKNEQTVPRQRTHKCEAEGDKDGTGQEGEKRRREIRQRSGWRTLNSIAACGSSLSAVLLFSVTKQSQAYMLSYRVCRKRSIALWLSPSAPLEHLLPAGLFFSSLLLLSLHHRHPLSSSSSPWLLLRSLLASPAFRLRDFLASVPRYDWCLLLLMCCAVVESVVVAPLAEEEAQQQHRFYVPSCTTTSPTSIGQLSVCRTTLLVTSVVLYCLDADDR